MSRVAQQLPWLRSGPGLVGLLALVASAVMGAGWAPDWRDAAAQAEAEQRLLQRQQRRASQALTATAAAAPDPQAQARAWWQALPPAPATPGRVADLIEHALRAGLVVQGTRQDEPEPSTPVARDRGAFGATAAGPSPPPGASAAAGVLAQPLAMRLSGPYTALRRFVADALQADPALVLGQLNAVRTQPQDSDLAIDLQWTLLARLGSVSDLGPALAPTDGSATVGSPGLPARPADWPSPAPAALAAWQPAPSPAAPSAPAVAAAPPPPPPTPRLPYQWLGVLDDGQQPRALLGGAGRAGGLAVGEVLDQRWRLERIGSAQLEFTYLPTGQRIGLGAPGTGPARPATATEPDNT